MNRYKILNLIGDFGNSHSLLRAENKETGELVVIKKFKKKFYTWLDCMSLREIVVLRSIQHPNIIRLKEIIKVKEDLFLVYEYFDETLTKYYLSIFEKGEFLPEKEIRVFLYELFKVVGYIHQQGFFHRDLKPSNIFITAGREIRLGGFSKARESGGKLKTDYITTGYYRSPEQLLKSQYGPKSDMFSIGCIMAELYNMGPFFVGSNEIDQLHKICSVLGTPNSQEWPDFHVLAKNVKIQLSEMKPVNLGEILIRASTEAIDLLKKLFHFNPAKRWSCQDCLKHPYFVNLKIDPLISDKKKPVEEKKHLALRSDGRRASIKKGEKLNISRVTQSDLMNESSDSIGRGLPKINNPNSPLMKSGMSKSLNKSMPSNNSIKPLVLPTITKTSSEKSFL